MKGGLRGGGGERHKPDSLDISVGQGETSMQYQQALMINLSSSDLVGVTFDLDMSVAYQSISRVIAIS